MQWTLHICVFYAIAQNFFLFCWKIQTNRNKKQWIWFPYTLSTVALMQNRFGKGNYFHLRRNFQHYLLSRGCKQRNPVDSVCPIFKIEDMFYKSTLGKRFPTISDDKWCRWSNPIFQSPSPSHGPLVRKVQKSMFMPAENSASYRKLKNIWQFASCGPYRNFYAWINCRFYLSPLHLRSSETLWLFLWSPKW